MRGHDILHSIRVSNRATPLVISGTCLVPLSPQTSSLDKSLIGTLSFRQPRDVCCFFFMFCEANLCSLYLQGRSALLVPTWQIPISMLRDVDPLPFVLREEDLYQSWSLWGIPVRFCLRLLTSLDLEVLAPSSRCLTTRGPHSLLEDIVRLANFFSRDPSLLPSSAGLLKSLQVFRDSTYIFIAPLGMLDPIMFLCGKFVFIASLSTWNLSRYKSISLLE